VHEYVALTLTDAHIQIQYLDVPAAVYVSRPTAVVDGQVLLPAASGTVTVMDDETTTHDIRDADLLLGGHITLALSDADSARGRTDVRGSGDLTLVAYGGSEHGYDWATVAAAGLGALIFAALAWASGAAKSVAGAIGGLLPGYARVHGDGVLEHPARSELYALVQANPGLHFMELCDKVDFGASTLNHHLRVLERNQFVSRVRDGRYCRFFDQRAGLYSRERKHAASVLRNDATAAIVAHIIQHPGIAQRDLADHFGIAPSTVSWHIDRLQREGLVQKQRDRHFTRYYMGTAWSDLPTGELARVGLVA
jgi:DNA-binding MarR family transcriptional regulator